MITIDITSVFVFVVVLVVSFLVLLNIQLDESINDNITKFGISVAIALSCTGGYLIYINMVSDELMTDNFAFDEVALPEGTNV